MNFAPCDVKCPVCDTSLNEDDDFILKTRRIPSTIMNDVGDEASPYKIKIIMSNERWVWMLDGLGFDCLNDVLYWFKININMIIISKRTKWMIL